MTSSATIPTKLEDFLRVIPLIHSMLPDVGIGVTSTEEWLMYSPGRKIDIGARAGMKIKPGEPLAECIRTGKVIEQDVPPEFFGMAFKGLATPIKEGNKVIGAVAIQIQEQNERELRRIAEQIVTSIVQANERVSTIAQSAEGLTDISNELLQKSNQASLEMENTDEVLKFIKKIADQTNLLGLNASIEAARAGEHGRGFDIVAKEIRKLSFETVSSTEKIRNTLDNMKESINEITTSIEKVVSVGKNQALSTEEIASFMDEIEKMSKELNTYASKI